jgi:unsaturated rhamnogalacturonyl hydrolase
MKNVFVIIAIIIFSHANAQPLSQQLASTVMHIWPDSFALPQDKLAKWRYDQGVILKGIEGIWTATGDAKWFDYIKKSMDFYVQPDGSIKGYKKDEFNIDHINNGKLLLLLYRVTGQEKYLKASKLLRSQLYDHPRTSEGGFWHKKIYPFQMWLDGLYMGQPFYAEYAMIMNEDSSFNDIARQFILMEKYARNAKTGLLYHGWDESRQQQWADKQTGLSPNFWARSLGWYGMALVDVLDYFPQNHKDYKALLAILSRFAKAVVSVQDANSGLWYDVPDQPTVKGNYVEASASSMLVYTLAKGVRKGYLDKEYLQNARSGYAGIIKEFIKKDEQQYTILTGTVSVSGLSGNPYRDGSVAYYLSEPVIDNDPKGMGAFIKAAVEMEMLPTLSIGEGQSILLDNYFNNEWKTGPAGQMPYHYTWSDRSNSGFSMLGDIFNSYGVTLKTLSQAPTAKKLKGASIYLIVDPDTEKETEQPNFIQKKHVKQLKKWVKKGGVLVLLANDAGNAELNHLNQLADKFDISFNMDNINMVKDNRFEEGVVNVPAGNPIFTSSPKLFIKELASLQLGNEGIPVLTKDDKVIMAISKKGKGTVFALGDPWLYNEYVDGRKLPADFQNHLAANEWVKWLIGQTK